MSKSLYSVTENPFTGGGIFTALQQLEPPWADEGIAAMLDLTYYGNYSGDKITSPLVDKLLTGGKLTAVATASLAGALMATNGERWAREWATMAAEYDPIQNYNMEEEMTDDETVTEYGHTRTRTDNLAHSETRTDNLAHAETRTDNLTHTVDDDEVTTPALTTTRQEATRAFNSSSDVNTDKTTESSSGTSRLAKDVTEHDTGTQSTSGTDTGTQTSAGTNTGTQADAESGSDTQTRNYKLTRKGNIGVTTSQQMLESERNLWAWSYFYDVVFPDVDQLMTTPIYSYDEAGETASGGITPTGTIRILTNGEYDVTRYAEANVSVPNTYAAADEGKVVENGALVSQTDETITVNGTYDTIKIKSVNVSVPNTYADADEGKVVDNGALVSQTDETITLNGTYDTTKIKSVNVNIKPLIANYDFTQREADYIHNLPLKNVAGASRTNSGFLFDSLSDYVQLYNTYFPEMLIEVEMGSMQLSGTGHKRLLMWDASSGFIYRSSGVWAIYSGAWTDTDITEPLLFSNSILGLRLNYEGYITIYKDGSQLWRSPSTYTSLLGNNIMIGSSGGQSFYDMTVKGVKIYG